MQLDLLKIKEALAKENKPIIDALKKELHFQKHIGKGTLLNGFYYRIVNTKDSISLLILNDTPYMWTVNDGNKNGVNASYQAIADWTFNKEVNGELTFSSAHERNNFISSVKHELENRYLTRGGERVAPRRYFFIDFVRGDVTLMSPLVKRMENAVVDEVKGILEKELVEKTLQLTIG